MVKAEITNLRAEFAEQYKARLLSLVDDAFNTYKTLVNTADRDSVRLKAAEQILKTNGVLTEKQEIEVSGEIVVPVINFVNKRPEED